MAGFKGRKSNIADFELVRLNIREEKRLPADQIPGCWGQPVLKRPECNHLVRSSKSNPTLLCQLRKSCAFAYAESPHRLGLDVSKVKTWEELIPLIQAEEARIGFTNEIPACGLNPKSDNTPAVPVVSKPKEMKKPMQKIGSPTKTVEAKKPSAPAEDSIRSIVVGFLKDPEGLSKADIVSRLEEKLQKKPLNPAAQHKIALALQPKTQKKYGYYLTKERRDGTWYYKLGVPESKKYGQAT
jgi:hypothetical protein